MKKIKYFFIFLSCLLCFSCSPFKSNKYTTLIGSSRYSDVINKVSEELKLIPNTFLSRQVSDYKMDYKMIDEEPLVYSESGNHMSKDLLSNSSLVIFSYDINDVLASKKEEYNIDDKKKDYALFDYYLELTYDEFFDKYNTFAIVLGIYEDDCSVYKGYIEEFNDVLLEKAMKYNMKYISTLFLSNCIEEEKINEEGVNKLSKLIISEYE